VIVEAGILARVLGPTGAEHRRTANRTMAEALEQAGARLEDLEYIVATGYGRINVPFADRQITEISCHARGVVHFFPEAAGIIDIGGQDSKGIKLSQGRVVDFVMNDKCAAGTGRFLEVIAEALGLTVEEIGPLSLGAGRAVRISNVCTVFAEQEVVGQLAGGAPVAEILAGLHEAIAGRVSAMFARLKMQGRLVVTGGGALNVGLVKALKDKMGRDLVTTPLAQFAGAVGAAMLAKDLAEQARDQGRPLTRGGRRLEAVTFFNGAARS
jgi:predicted CoA-substrate-specific enzyme activase